MAEVDFSNARIEPWSEMGRNPTVSASVSLEGLTDVFNSNKQSIGVGVSRYRIVDEQKRMVYLYNGAFTASGTEFYLIAWDGTYYNGWKISNISFQNGDTFMFKIRADLICQ